MDRILPNILATFTGTRQKTEIVWYKNNWIGNMFRLWEMIFWCRVGVVWQGGARVDSNGREYQVFGTWENAAVFFEDWIRGLRPRLVPVRMVIPVLQPAHGIPMLSSPFLFAVAFDTTAITTYGASPRTVSVTVTGSNTIMFATGVSGTDVINSKTYNSVSLTNINKTSYGAPSGRNGMTLDYLIAPTTGSNTLSYGSSSGSLGAACDTFSGAKQTSQPDSSNVVNDDAEKATITLSTTCVVSDCMLVGGVIDEEGVGGTAGLNTTRDQRSDQGLTWGHSTATVASGSQSIVFAFVPTVRSAWTIASIAPFVTAGPTNVKTWDGVTQSTGIKTYLDLALASVKSVNGVT